jgi:hypothetical protein
VIIGVERLRADIHVIHMACSMLPGLRESIVEDDGEEGRGIPLNIQQLRKERWWYCYRVYYVPLSPIVKQISISSSYV